MTIRVTREPAEQTTRPLREMPPRAPLRLTYIGGPTALIEWRGVRLLTDPTFDPAATTYHLAGYDLHKTQPPAIDADCLGPIDVVLLSHDHHVDNLDGRGREVASRATYVVTTEAGAARIGANAVGLAPWMSEVIVFPDRRALEIRATPAQHGPRDGDRGPVIGFAVSFTDAPDDVLWVSGDTVWFEGTEEVARRYAPRLAILFVGAARVLAAGPSPLTLTATEAVVAARALPGAMIAPLHFEGWAHFTESRRDVEAAFAAAGLEARLVWLPRGEAIDIP